MVSVHQDLEKSTLGEFISGGSGGKTWKLGFTWHLGASIIQRLTHMSRVPCWLLAGVSIEATVGTCMPVLSLWFYAFSQDDDWVPKRPERSCIIF